ncbi:hypothetical protein GGR50DRAFT_677625 [Xylaria sp. CBS 124048]|nr:hypothetical protein GGR50DRAFT_677625 [Xylaria sp. CBS 124048]
MVNMIDLGELDDDYDILEPPHIPQQRLPRHTRLSSNHSHRRLTSNASTSNQFPAGPPSMSPAASPLSPLRRRLSPLTMSPSSPLYPQWTRNQANTAQPSRDALAQRLNALAMRLSQEDNVEDESINLLHAKVDELENVLHSPDAYQHRTETSPGPRPFNPEVDPDESDIDWMAPYPTNLLPSDASSISSTLLPSPPAKTRVGHQDDTREEPHAPRMTVAQTERVIEEANNLREQLENIIANLCDRQEETEHIHELLIMRLERAAQRIITLEKRVKHLEKERKQSNTEILHLQIQLKAIEVRCLSYVPQDADQELRESIDTWKMEWSTLKQRRTSTRELLNSMPSTRRRAAPTAD